MAAAGKAKDFYKVLGVSEKADGDEIKLEDLKELLQEFTAGLD